MSECLVMNGDYGDHEDGDIIAVADDGFEWGAEEGPPLFRIETIDDGDYYVRKNLTASLVGGNMDDLPLTAYRNVRTLVMHARAKDRYEIKPRRYKVTNGKIVDKKHG